MKITFADAIKLAFKNYANFGGRSTRPEYWYFILFNVLVTAVANAIDFAMTGKTSSGLVGNVASIVLFLPLLTVLVRRFRDAGVSPLWLLTWLIPVGALIASIVINFPALERLAASSDELFAAASGTQAQMELYFYAHPELINLTTDLLLVLGIFLIWALFELIVTLLPTKKAKEQLVASTDY